jgi:hypothetical protein
MEAEMGLLDNLGLGDMLKSLLGQAETNGGLPALINAVLAKTEYRDLNGLWLRCKKAASTTKSNPGSALAPICRSAPSN